ncbi:MAG TPA: non-canonical purine NTP pyrophosphatase, RdgB/HAM1 family [Cyanobacteria bacterium UBA11149]|nr:non-canonical purine NTP pyrophosphatase, RdgB/HAM1 family [Cyanobacteria bacterium UBA11367]HBE59970.1 non-canonical purine NTP pyrophosphatase, RdgB/HAM1 family [Cyanobacteria bacterium UBA11366]HBK63224.1 non-canonical purine NTP pyrophosphatase, RdgB/HAM1 family [Cyanobacteria bacterium UBA11166]HBS69550.1 non-canonical purine NTP pyrophosphatase, RdgB/HAM1 family [Cyanobacteria bacterium UBA11153]HBW88099.1 non-canonical purine NTP pyrophosphatase, RdgB/HAM1 family [Cyanobacteria bacter
MTILVVATGNHGKLREMQSYLTDLGWELELKPPEIEIEETGNTFAANAALKASGVAIATGKWAIADDSGLAVDALDGAPGIYSARYGQTDRSRIERLLLELGNEINREAQFVCAIAVANPHGAIVLQVEGICKGEILHSPRGTGGFGYDPIFYVPEAGLTFAEMTPETKRCYSHRGKAMALLIRDWGLGTGG